MVYKRSNKRILQDKVIKKLAFELFRTQRALEVANKMLFENEQFGVLVDLASPSFRNARHENKQIKELIEKFTSNI
jgi:hypothetical protein